MSRSKTERKYDNTKKETEIQIETESHITKKQTERQDSM